MSKKEITNESIEKDCEITLGGLWNKRVSIIMPLRTEHETLGPEKATDKNWQAYLKALEPFEKTLSEITDNIKKAYKTRDRREHLLWLRKKKKLIDKV